MIYGECKNAAYEIKNPDHFFKFPKLVTSSCYPSRSIYCHTLEIFFIKPQHHEWWLFQFSIIYEHCVAVCVVMVSCIRLWVDLFFMPVCVFHVISLYRYVRSGNIALHILRLEKNEKETMVLRATTSNCRIWWCRRKYVST